MAGDRSPDRFDAARSVCPYCAVGCQLAYDPAAGRATGLVGAVNRDGRLCPKGLGAYDRPSPADRLTTPLVREGGRLREASWATALDRAAEGLAAAADAHGPDALAFLGAPRCTNEENYRFGKIARLLGTNNVDNRARTCHAATGRAMADRLGSGAMTNTVEDLREADAFLVVGADPAERQPVAFDRAVRPALADGATLIGVDPRRSATIRLADHHLAARPGADAAVLAAMTAVVVEADLHDRTFVAERTTGFEPLADALGALDVDSVAADAGVDPTALRAAARAFGRADRGAALVGTGMEPPGHADTAAADALLNLLLLTGNLGRRGTGMNLLRGLTNEQGASDAGCRPDRLPGHVPVTDAAGRERLEAEWGVAPPAEPGRPHGSLVEDFGDGVRAAWVLGEDPAVTNRDPAAVAAGLDALETLVVQEVVRTGTVERADVVLPAADWTEKAGTVTNLDRQVQRLRPAADPPAGVRSDLDILRALGERLTGADLGAGGPRAVFAEQCRVAPPYAGMDYDAVGTGSQRWPFPAGASAGTAVLHRDRFESGRRRAPLVPVAPTTATGDDLRLVATRSVTEFVGARPTGSARRSDGSVTLHPDDAAARGLADGDPVVLETPRGAVDATVAVSTDVRPGTAAAAARTVDAVVGEHATPVAVRPADEGS